MTAPAGPCEWCGGPQWWTIVRGEMFVKCQGGCVSLWETERYNVPPPDGEVVIRLHAEANGTFPKEGVVTLEGSGPGWTVRTMKKMWLLLVGRSLPRFLKEV